ncbi:hypothetical protein [Gordonia phosphorivorans]|uniref:HNH endonuclease n=1 Tax=Gordonia phosphorivorans TaxID=1056982 RepID=A0ABV6H7C2_9ACTN
MTSTTARQLGWKHQQETERLKANHVDGAPCWWCGRPMFLAPEKNPDGKPLSGDHSLPRARGGTTTDRLLHAICNSERGDGSRDDQRPALGGRDRQETGPLGVRRLPWPF